MIQSNSYKDSDYSKKFSSPHQQSNRSFKKHESLLVFNKKSSLSKPSQPQLESEELFFKASLEYIRKKKIDHYFLFFDELMGQGSFAKVYKGMNILTNEIVAIKVMEMKHIVQKKLYVLLQAQIQILKSLKHPNVLRCYDILITDNHCYIVTELCNDGQLKQFIKKQQKLKVKDSTVSFTIEPLIYGVYQGLLYLQRKNIIHRDIKMANILVKDGKAKIADFGFAVFSKGVFTDIRVGSPIYMAPEAFLRSIYSLKTDVWAFGILLFEFYHGYSPFENCLNNQELQKELRLPFKKDKINKKTPEEAIRVIFDCLTYDSQTRPSFKELWTHNFIKNLRFKSYVESKQLNFYKEITSSSNLKQMEKAKSEMNLSVDSSFCLNQNEKSPVGKFQQEKKQQKGQDGCSFQEFFQLHERKQIKTTCIISPEKTIEENSVYEQEKSQENKQLFDQMAQFYRQAQKMMKTQENAQELHQTILKEQDRTKKSPKKMQQVNLNQYIEIQNIFATPISIKSLTNQQASNGLKGSPIDILGQELKIQHNSPQKLAKIKTQTSQLQYKEQSVSKIPQVSDFIATIKPEIDQKQSYLPKRSRKINLQKNYCSDLNRSKQPQSPKIQTLDDSNQHLILEKKKQLNDEVDLVCNYSKKKEVDNLVENMKVQSQENLSAIILNKETEKDQQQKKVFEKHEIPKKKVKNHNQNLQKFWNMVVNQQTKHYPNHKIVNKSRRQIQLNKQSQQIDQIFFLLEFSRFIVKFLKFIDRLEDEESKYRNLSDHKRQQILEQFSFQQSYNLMFASDSLKSEVFLRDELFSVCNRLLMKKVSQTILNFSFQKNFDLLDIVKTHKNLLKRIQEESFPLKMNQTSRTDFSKKRTQEILEKVFQALKIIEEPVTKLNDWFNKNSRDETIFTKGKRLCWIGIWLSKIYEFLLFASINLTTCRSKSTDRKQIQTSINKLTKEMEKFGQNYESQMHNIFPQFDSLQQKTFNENTIKSDINYFFQLVYEIQLQRMNMEFS